MVNFRGQNISGAHVYFKLWDMTHVCISYDIPGLLFTKVICIIEYFVIFFSGIGTLNLIQFSYDFEHFLALDE